jgi:hypothetical protein
MGAFSYSVPSRDYAEPQMLLASQILAHLIGLCIKLKRSANAERLETPTMAHRRIKLDGYK